MQNRASAPNGRYFDRLSISFGASGAVARLKVCTNLEVLRPSERQWKPRLRQATGRWAQAILWGSSPSF